MSKKERESCQHCAQVFCIWDAIKSKPNQRGLEDINNFKNIELWYNQNRDKPPGTVRSYLSSLALFLDFLIVNNASKHVTEQCTISKTLVKTLSKSLSKAFNRRQVKVQADDIRKFIANHIGRLFKIYVVILI